MFELSPSEAPLPGACDEVRWFLYTWSPAQNLPPALQPEQAYRFGFDARGEPTAAPVIRYVGEEARQ